MCLSFLVFAGWHRPNIIWEVDGNTDLEHAFRTYDEQLVQLRRVHNVDILSCICVC